LVGEGEEGASDSGSEQLQAEVRNAVAPQHHWEVRCREVDACAVGRCRCSQVEVPLVMLVVDATGPTTAAGGDDAKGKKLSSQLAQTGCYLSSAPLSGQPG
jgi:hypothetical protein